jgi:hypothetical protein
MAAEFDIPAREFDFKKDLAYGQQGESLISSFLDSLSGGSFEVKSDRYRNGRMAIETDQNPRAAKHPDGSPLWVKSGINITTAKWWVYIFSPEGGFVVVDTGRLKRFLRANKNLYNESTKRNFGGADNPARGFIIMPEQVTDLLINPAYDEKNN